jgi:hypothetical protein
MLEINDHFKNIEITGNFLLGDTLSFEHDESLAAFLESVPVSTHRKGAIYLSPLKDSSKKRELLPRFHAIKNRSQLPV